jgi:hypothetical protein
MTQENGPLLVELDAEINGAGQDSPYDSDPIPMTSGLVAQSSMSAPAGTRFLGYALSAVFGILALFVSLWLWDFTLSLFARHFALGWIALALVAVLGLAV